MTSNNETRARRAAAPLWFCALAILLIAKSAAAQTAAPAAASSLEVYGFLMADAIADFKTNNPDWFDTVRPSKLPKFEDEFGKDGHFYVSPRQSRFGVRTAFGEMKGQFEFDMAGVGPDAGLTTIRLRHAWGQWRQIGGGQTNSQFMDIDVFPNTVEYWGPNGMLFLRTAQLFYEGLAKPDGTNWRVAIEGAGASGDGGVYADRIEVQSIKPRFPSPDFAGHYRAAYKWGYLQGGGILRYLAYDDLLPNDAFDLSGHTWGWGLTLSSNVKATENDTLRLQVTTGAGIQNYFNDAPIDVSAQINPSNKVTPITGEALPVTGLSAYLDHTWNKTLSSAVGYSRIDMNNTDGQAPDAYKNGQYFSTNVLYTPIANVMMGGEFLWAQRQNFSDGWTANDYRIQVSFKYSFSHKIIGG